MYFSTVASFVHVHATMCIRYIQYVVNWYIIGIFWKLSVLFSNHVNCTHYLWDSTVNMTGSLTELNIYTTMLSKHSTPQKMFFIFFWLSKISMCVSYNKSIGSGLYGLKYTLFVVICCKMPQQGQQQHRIKFTVISLLTLLMMK